MKNKTQKGYALLITVVVISIILLIATGLSNSTTKQLILSSSAKDSQTAFYQADTASECALYADRVEAINNPDLFTSGGAWTCGTTSATPNLTVIPKPNGGGFIIAPKGALTAGSTPCFRIDVTKDTTTTPGTILTTIKAKGYNICNTSNIRTVERTIQVSY